MTIALYFECKITKTFCIHKKSELFYCFSLLSKNAPSHLKALFSFYSIFAPLPQPQNRCDSHLWYTSESHLWYAWDSHPFWGCGRGYIPSLSKNYFHLFHRTYHALDKGHLLVRQSVLLIELLICPRMWEVLEGDDPKHRFGKVDRTHCDQQ